MKKDTFKISIFILLVGGLITKIFSFIIKIIFTREVGSYGISLYTIVMPTYSLFITIASFALPISISKLVSEDTIRSKKIVLSTIFFILLFNFLIVLLILFSGEFIATILLKQPEVTPIIYAMAFTLPFVSLTAILKGYFLGKIRVAPNTISNIFEQLFRIFFLIVILPSLVSKSILLGVISFILLNIVTEIISILTFCFFLPKKIHLQKQDFIPESNIISRVLHISVPSVSSRLIGNIGFFLEPIILTNLLIFSGYSGEFILSEYASYNAYAIGLLTMPSFFIGAICQILIPEISKYHEQNNQKMVKRRLQQALTYSFLIGLSFSILILIFRNPLLNILYKTTSGSNYILALAPFFVLFYLEAPLESSLQALDKAGITLKISLWSIIFKLCLMGLLSLCHIGLYALVISEIFDIIFVVYFNGRALHKCLQRKSYS